MRIKSSLSISIPVAIILLIAGAPICTNALSIGRGINTGTGPSASVTAIHSTGTSISTSRGGIHNIQRLRCNHALSSSRLFRRRDRPTIYNRSGSSTRTSTATCMSSVPPSSPMVSHEMKVGSSSKQQLSLLCLCIYVYAMAFAFASGERIELH